MMILQLKRAAAQVFSMSLLMSGCGDGDELPERPIVQVGMMDAGSWDAGPLDARVPDAGDRDASAGNE